MRNKIPDYKKKKKFSITIDEKLSNLFDSHIGDDNKSKYIENLIRKDMEERGEKIKREF